MGVNVSADAFVGFVRGGIENVKGLMANFNLTLGPVGITVLADPKTGSFMGVTGGLGPAATPVGASSSLTYTGTLTQLETSLLRLLPPPRMEAVANEAKKIHR